MARIRILHQIIQTQQGLEADHGEDGKLVAIEPAALLEDLGDPIPRIHQRPEGQHFDQAWKTARIIVDADGGHRDDKEEPGSPPPVPAIP